MQANTELTSWPTPPHQTACHENAGATVTEEHGASQKIHENAGTTVTEEDGVPRKVGWKKKHNQVEL